MPTPLFIDASILHGFDSVGVGSTRAFTTEEEIYEAVRLSANDLATFVWRRRNLTRQHLRELRSIRKTVQNTKIFKFWTESDFTGIVYWDLLVSYSILRSRWDGRHCRHCLRSTGPPPQMSPRHLLNLKRFYKTNGATVLSMEFLVDPGRCCETEDPIDPPNWRRRWMRRSPSPIKLLGERR
jgi:hypothetical protein